MANNKIDWSQYEVKQSAPEKIDWSQYEEKPQSNIEEEYPNIESTGLSGVFEDLLGSALSGVDYIKNIPGMSNDFLEALIENPLKHSIRSVGQFGAGTAELGKGLINSPKNISNYLHKKELTLGDKALNFFFPDEEPISEPIKNEKDLAESLKNTIRPNLMRNIYQSINNALSDILPGIPEDTGIEKALNLEVKKGEKLIRTLPEVLAVGAGTTALTKSIVNKTTSIGKEALYNRAMNKKIEIAKDVFNLSKEDLKKLQEALELEYSEKHTGQLGKLSSSGQQVKINEKARKIKKLEPESQLAIEHGESIPEKPNVKGAEESLYEAMEGKRSHAQHGGRIYQERILNDKNTSSQLYDEYRDDLSHLDIKVNNDKKIKEVSRSLEELVNADELAPGYGSGTPEELELRQELSKLQNETVNAKDVFSAKRTLDKLADQTREKQYSGVTDEEFKILGQRADKFEKEANKLGSLLESVSTPEIKQKLVKANKLWSQYASARGNKFGRKLINEGVLPPDMIEKLQSTLRGNEYLRSIAEESPQLQKHILSQKYAKPSQFKHLLEPNEEVAPYLANREDLHPFIENLRETKYANEGYNTLVKSMKTHAEIKDLEQQIKFHEKSIPKLKEKEKSIEKNSAEHKRLKKELEEHQQNIKDKNHKLKLLKDTALKLLGYSAIGKKSGL